MWWLKKIQTAVLNNFKGKASWVLLVLPFLTKGKAKAILVLEIWICYVEWPVLAFHRRWCYKWDPEDSSWDLSIGRCVETSVKGHSWLQHFRIRCGGIKSQNWVQEISLKKSKQDGCHRGLIFKVNFSFLHTNIPWNRHSFEFLWSWDWNIEIVFYSFVLKHCSEN